MVEWSLGRPNSALPPKADMRRAGWDGRYVTDSVAKVPKKGVTVRAVNPVAPHREPGKVSAGGGVCSRGG
jgi:hypothetical protein